MDPIHARARQIALIQDAKGLGTGLVVSPDGWIVTNKHVAPSAGPFRVVLASGRDVHGVGVHQSPHHDLALVKVAAATPDFLDLEREVSDEFRVGDVVYALGHPRGCRFSVARGIISNPHREFDKEYFIQTDVSINPGNSGGPLVDERGRLVGIVTMVLTHSQGLGFAVPGYTAADYARTVHRLIRHGVVKVPTALLEAADRAGDSPAEVVRRALGMLSEQGRVAIKEELPDEGTTKLERRGAAVRVTVDGGALVVHGDVCTLGPAERSNARFLGRLLELGASRELGGACFGLDGDRLRVTAIRSAARLDVVDAFELVDAVAHLTATWAEKVTTLFLEDRHGPSTLVDAAPSATATDPGYPLLHAPPLTHDAPATPAAPQPPPADDPGYPILQMPPMPEGYAPAPPPAQPPVADDATTGAARKLPW